MYNKLIGTFKFGLRNLSGWRTNRKIVVFESDDWGSMRMPSIKAYNSLLNAGIRVDNCPYNQFDSLATEEDLERMFKVLGKFKDLNGKPPVITANCVVANPDFEKIRASGFSEYHYELFTTSLKNTIGCQNSFELWKKGIDEGLFFPQFHGREHLNIKRWLNALQSDFPETKYAFDQGVFGISTNITKEKRKSYLPALDFDSIDELPEKEQILKDGLVIFEKEFGFRSTSFIATNYIWHSLIEKALSDSGIRFIQGIQNQFEPQGGDLPIRKVKHYLGQKNKFEQIYLRRNCSFEPSIRTSPNSVTDCLNEIDLSFRLRKPAVISVHRLNFIGALVPENRNNNLKMFEQLLSEIIKRHPQVEFLNTAELGHIVVS